MPPTTPTRLLFTVDFIRFLFLFNTFIYFYFVNIAFLGAVVIGVRPSVLQLRSRSSMPLSSETLSSDDSGESSSYTYTEGSFVSMTDVAALPLIYPSLNVSNNSSYSGKLSSKPSSINSSSFPGIDTTFSMNDSLDAIVPASNSTKTTSVLLALPSNKSTSFSSSSVLLANLTDKTAVNNTTAIISSATHATLPIQSVASTTVANSLYSEGLYINPQAIDPFDLSNPIQINRTSILGYMNDGDVIYLRCPYISSYLVRCDNCVTDVNSFNTSIMLWTGDIPGGPRTPGRLGQIAVELVNITDHPMDSTKSAFIRLRADNGNYIRAVPQPCSDAIPCTQDPRFNNYTLFADSVAANVDHTVFELYGDQHQFFLRMSGGYVLHFGPFYKNRYSNQVLSVFRNDITSPFLTAKPATDVSFATSTRPLLSGNVLAPFSSGDAIQMHSDGRMLAFSEQVQDTHNSGNRNWKIDNVILATTSELYKNTSFVVTFVGDPRQGIVRFSLKDGRQLFLADKSSECDECQYIGGRILFADNSGHTTDWKLVSADDPSYSNGWILKAVAIDEQQLTTPSKLCMLPLFWPNSGYIADNGGSFLFSDIHLCEAEPTFVFNVIPN